MSAKVVADPFWLFFVAERVDKLCAHSGNSQRARLSALVKVLSDMPKHPGAREMLSELMRE